jgi:hypothetical protein
MYTVVHDTITVRIGEKYTMEYVVKNSSGAEVNIETAEVEFKLGLVGNSALITLTHASAGVTRLGNRIRIPVDTSVLTVTGNMWDQCKVTKDSVPLYVSEGKTNVKQVVL